MAFSPTTCEGIISGLSRGLTLSPDFYSHYLSETSEQPMLSCNMCVRSKAWRVEYHTAAQKWNQNLEDRTWSRPESGQVLAASGLHPRGRAVRWEHRPLTGFPQPQWVCSPPGTTAGLKNSAEITSHIGVSPSTGFPSQPEQELAGMEANPGG